MPESEIYLTYLSHYGVFLHEAYLTYLYHYGVFLQEVYLTYLSHYGVFLHEVYLTYLSHNGVFLLWFRHFIFEISGKPSFVEAVLRRVTQFFYLLCFQFLQKASGWINKTLLLIKQHITYMNIIVGCPTKDFCEFALTELHTPVWYIVGMRRTSRIEIKMSSLCIVVTSFLNWGQRSSHFYFSYIRKL
jgi:hypothetical protein